MRLHSFANLRWLGLSFRRACSVVPVASALAVSLAAAHGQGITSQGPAGQYAFQVTTSGPTRITSGPGWIKVEWTGDPGSVNPPPVVPPPPDPGTGNPPPAPVKPIVLPNHPVQGPVFFVAVYNGPGSIKSFPSGQQDLLADKTVGPALKPARTYWRVYDLTDPNKPLNGWEKDAQQAGNPGLLIIGEGGKLLASGSLSASKSDLLALHDKLRGK